MSIALPQPFFRPRSAAGAAEASCSRPCSAGRDVRNVWLPRRSSLLSARASVGHEMMQLRSRRLRRQARLGSGFRLLALADPASGPSVSGEEEKAQQPATTGQLWSSLILKEGKLVHQPGSVVAAAALVAGSTVGAGVLALPAATASSGFVASGVALTAGWGFSILTGLLIAEVSYAMLRKGVGGVSLLAMAQKTLGNNGATLATVAYLFQSYALLVAYISRGGEIINTRVLGGETHNVGQAVFSIGIALALYSASPKQLDTVNTSAVFGVVASLVALVFLVAPGVDPERLMVANWEEVVGSVPVILLAFVYQNIVPVIVTQLEGDMRKVTTAIVAGTAVPWAMFVSWDAAVLGQGGAGGPVDYERAAIDPVALVQASGGAGGALLDAFALLAVGTSFVGFVIALSDFLVEMIGQVPTGRPAPLAYAGVVLPPLAVAVTYPDLFFPALEYAGLFGVLVLWGVMPAAMALNTRKMIATGLADPGGRGVGGEVVGAGLEEPLPSAAVAPGGNAAAWAVIAFSSLVIVYDVATQVTGKL